MSGSSKFQDAMWQRMSAVQGITPPKITFGLELEMHYVLRKENLARFLKENPTLKADYHTIERLEYICTIVNSQEPPSAKDKVPSFNNCQFVDINMDDEPTGYDTWQVGNDISTIAEYNQVSHFLGTSVENWESIFRIQDGVELISIPYSVPLAAEIYHVDNTNLAGPPRWQRELEQIERNMTLKRTTGGAFCNKTCALHVHMSLTDYEEPPLSLIKQLILLWAMCEDIIRSMHPSHRHKGKYASSLLSRSNVAGATWNQFSEAIYGSQSVEEVKRFTRPTTFVSKFLKINISEKKESKKCTIEFREHRGTYCASEILHWVSFCRKMVEYSWILAHYNYTIKGDEIRDIAHLLTVISMGDEGKQFYLQKAAGYGGGV